MLTPGQWQGRNATRLADYTGFNDAAKTISASLNDKMPVMQLAETEPVVKNYMDIQAGALCYTYSSM
jgi:tyrosinase